MDKLDQYFLTLSTSLENKTVAITGATGSLGFFISYFCLLQRAKVVLIGRSKSKLIETFNSLKNIFTNSTIEYLICDFSNIEQVKRLGIKLRDLKIDFLFNNAGCYHLPIKIIDGHDITFITNFIAPIYLTNYVNHTVSTCKIVQTTSLSFKFSKLNFKDIVSIKTKNIFGRMKNVR